MEIEHAIVGGARGVHGADALLHVQKQVPESVRFVHAFLDRLVAFSREGDRKDSATVALGDGSPVREYRHPGERLAVESYPARERERRGHGRRRIVRARRERGGDRRKRENEAQKLYRTRPLHALFSFAAASTSVRSKPYKPPFTEHIVTVNSSFCDIMSVRSR